jgi:hypothetical protein
MKNFRECATILVIAVCLGLLGGCADMTGGSTVGLIDGTYGSDGYSSPETNTNSDTIGNDTVGKDVVDVCAPYKYLKGTKWFCDVGVTCVLDVLVHTDGLCWVVCPVKIWGVPADTLKFPSTGKLVYDMFDPGPNPHTCDKKAN